MPHDSGCIALPSAAHKPIVGQPCQPVILPSWHHSTRSHCRSLRCVDQRDRRCRSVRFVHPTRWHCRSVRTVIQTDHAIIYQRVWCRAYYLTVRSHHPTVGSLMCDRGWIPIFFSIIAAVFFIFFLLLFFLRRVEMLSLYNHFFHLSWCALMNLIISIRADILLAIMWSVLNNL